MEAWLKPNGELIEVGLNQHNEYAQELLEEEMGGIVEFMNYMADNNIEYPYSVLHLRGWVRIKGNASGTLEIYGDCISLVSPMRNTMDPAMNATQLRVANKLCEEYNTPFNQAINDKRFW